MKGSFFIFATFLTHTISTQLTPVSIGGDKPVLTSMDYPEYEEMAEIFKALNLPPDFATKNYSRSTRASSDNFVEIVKDHPKFFMTGNPELDALLQCPCYYSQLKNPILERYFANSNKSPQFYGWSSHDAKFGNKKLHGKAIGKFFGGLIKHSRSKLNRGRSKVLGLVDKSAKATKKLADFTAEAAWKAPMFARSKGEKVRDFTERVGDLTEKVLYKIEPIVSSAAIKTRNFADKLPHAIDKFQDKSQHLKNSVGKIAHHLVGASDKVTDGLLKVSQKKVNTLTKVVEGSQQFKSGLLEGLKESDSESHEGWELI